METTAAIGTKEIRKEQYPWSHLFAEMSSEMPVDTQELLAAQESTRSELAKQTQVVQQQAQLIQQQRDRLTDMQTISTKTFDTLSAKITELTDENTALSKKTQTLEQINRLTTEKMQNQQELLSAATEELQKHHDDAHSELVYQIIINQVIQHKAGVDRVARREKTFQNILVWLHQRKNVVKYLRRNNLVPKVSDDLENILFVDEKALNDLMAQLEF